MISIVDLSINCHEIESLIMDFIKSSVEKAGLDGAIVSVSGGIDSAVTLALTVKALTPEKVTAITLPERDITPQRDITDVMQHCRQLGLTCDTVDITSMLHVITDNLPNFTIQDRICTGNIKSRLRMIIGYYFANMQRKMVIGTSNKTELLTGFFTKYGDGGVDLLPLGGLYKTQIRQLGDYLKVPENIQKKPPSPGFFPGQTDEDDLGVDYTTIDLILYTWEKGYTAKEISDIINVDLNKVQSILWRVKNSEHKRRLPLLLRLS
jgi:NAD+ synthase